MAVVYGHSLFGVPVLGNLGTPPPPPKKKKSLHPPHDSPNRIYGQRLRVSDKVSRSVRVWVEPDDHNGIAAQTKHKHPENSASRFGVSTSKYRSTASMTHRGRLQAIPMDGL